MKNTSDTLLDIKNRYKELQQQHEDAKKEINRGNVIIMKLETQVKNLKAKTAAQRATLLSQEKTVADLEKELHTKIKTEEVRKTEIQDSHDRTVKLQSENDDIRSKLNEAASMISNNQSVIEYLNKQITERDLKSFAPLSTVNVPFGGSGIPAIANRPTHTASLSNNNNNRPNSTITKNMEMSSLLTSTSQKIDDVDNSLLGPRSIGTAAAIRLPIPTGSGPPNGGKYHDLNRLRNLLEASGAPIAGAVKYQMPKEN